MLDLDRRDPAFQALAREALVLTIEGDTAGAGTTLQQMADLYGGDGAVQAALLWLDTLAAALGHTLDSRGVAIAFQDVETGTKRTADGVRPTVAWAGRLMAARFADDESTFAALINTAGARPDFGAYIGELLHMIALQYRRVANARPGGV